MNKALSTGTCAERLSEQDSKSLRVRDVLPDSLQGLRGHDYIAARNLNQPVKRVQTFALANKASKEE